MKKYIILLLLLGCFACKKTKQQELEHRYANFCPVSAWAYKNNKYVRDDTVTRYPSEAMFGISYMLFRYVDLQKWIGDQYDWDMLVAGGRAVKNDPDYLKGTVDYFLVYEVESSLSGGCKVTIKVISGNPYDPNKQPVSTFVGLAYMGEDNEFKNYKVQSEQSCIQLAAMRAAKYMMDAGYADKQKF